VAVQNGDGVAVTYDRTLFDHLTTFPVGTTGRPTIPSSDPRYAPGGEGRISFV
jgi:hypothetical protein